MKRAFLIVCLSRLPGGFNIKSSGLGGLLRPRSNRWGGKEKRVREKTFPKPLVCGREKKGGPDRQRDVKRWDCNIFGKIREVEKSKFLHRAMGGGIG